MKAKIIYSNTFDTARNAVFCEIKNRLGEGRHILIVPDKFLRSYEIGLLEKLDLKATFNVEVMTFSRFAATGPGSGANRRLTPEGEVMLIKGVADSVRNDLSVYMDVSDKVYFAREMYGVISRFRNCGISPENLAGCGAEGETASKIKDISLIYGKYLSALKERNLEDGHTRLYAFADAIPDMTEMAETNVYVLDFCTFTEPQSAVLEQLVKYAASVTFGFICGEEDAANARLVPRTGMDRIENICGELKVSPETSDVQDDSLPPYKKKILTDLFGYRKTTPAETEGCVELYEAQAVSAEVEAVAERIRKLVSEEGMRYRDIAVVLSDPSAYASEIERIFSRFDVPFYIDRRALLSEQPAARYIIAALRCAESGFRFRDVLRLIKNPFFYGDDAGYGRTEEFENYCLENSVRGQLENLALSDGNAEKLRKRVLAAAEAFVRLRNSASGSAENSRKLTGLKCAEALRRFVEDNRLADKCKAAAEACSEQGMVSAQIYDRLSAFLDKTSVTLANARMSLGSFADTLEATLSSIKIAGNPQYLNDVYISDINTGLYDGCDVMFILGARDGYFPATVPDSAILGSAEETKLLARGLNVYPTRKDVLREERFLLAHFLLKHRKKLIVSYSKTCAAKEAKPSQMMMQLTEILCEKKDGNIYEKLKIKPIPIVGEPASQMKCPDAVKTEVPETAALREGTFSASLLESYFACPYKTFFEYGLNIKKRKEGVLNAAEIGTIKHAVMKNFIKPPRNGTKSRDVNLIDLTDEEWEAAVSDDGDVLKMIRDVVAWESKKLGKDVIDPELENTFNRIVQECVMLCGKIREQIRNSRFKPDKAEVEIKNLGSNAEIEVETDGKKYRLRGSVDRVDIHDGYFTVVDYKGSEKNLPAGKVYNGSHIQPVLYAAAVKRAGKGIPASILYQPLVTGYSTDENHFRMNGAFLNNPAVMKNLEVMKNPDSSDCDPEWSRYFHLKLASKDKLDGHTQNLWSDEAMDNMIEYAERLSAQALKELAAGNISPAPLSDTCRYCDYSSICPYADDERYVRSNFPSVKSKDFAGLLKGECPASCEKKEDGNDV